MKDEPQFHSFRDYPRLLHQPEREALKFDYEKADRELFVWLSLRCAVIAAVPVALVVVAGWMGWR